MGIRLSIVLPVYKVEKYLTACLDSVLSQTGAELEVIAVDDGSPDRSGRILDARAARDSRLRVLHLERNRGLGGAREAGLAEASGEYVWFVDSDDRLTRGAVAAVAERLTAVRPDVLITDFVRTYPDGGTEPDTWRRLMTRPALPDAFTLVDRPGLLQMVMAVWNKVVRRDFLLGLGVTFGPGYYEDISVTYPMLLAAERLSYLDRPCYSYRRMREGAITGTSSPKHLDAFAQYEMILGFLDRHEASEGLPAVPADLRRVVFDRTVRHAVTLYNTPHLVPPGLRREFFRRMTDHFTRHRPADYTFPRGSRGLRFRLVAQGSYGAYNRLQGVNSLRGQAKRVLAGPPGTTPSASRRTRSAARFAYYRACLRLPLDDNLAVYAAYWYDGYHCNPAAIYEEARRLAPSVRGLWVVAGAEQAATLPEGVPHVIAGTPAYLRAMATAKYLVNNVNFPHTTAKRPGSVHLQTQHGTPLKTMGLDLRDHPGAAGDMDFDHLVEHVSRWDYLVSPNPYTTQVFSRAYPGRYEVLETGYPRNDRFSTATAEDCAALRAGLGVPPDHTVILYAPTHREGRAPSTGTLDAPRLARELGPGHTLLVRAHYLDGDAPADADGAVADPGGGQVLDVTGHPSVEDLCLASDLLVTDYSSLMFDYAVLDRPIVVFAPDWEEYRRDRGVYFDLPADPPGVVATDQQTLTDLLVLGRADGAEPARRRARFRERFCPYDDGHAAERVVRRVFPVDPS